jgi:hypothetical protein
MHSGTKEGGNRLAAAFVSSGVGIAVTGHVCHHHMVCFEMVPMPEAPTLGGVPAACPIEEGLPVLSGYLGATGDGG